MALTQISTQGIKDGTITGTDLATNVDLVDNQKIRFGTGNDLQIYFDGTNSFIKEPNVVAGQLVIDGYNGTDIRRGATGEHMIRAIGGGSIELYHDGTKKFETTAGGSKVTGNFIVNSGNVSIDVDNKKLLLGASDDLQIYHDGSNSYINEAGTGDLIVKTNIFRVRGTNDEAIITGAENGNVALYYDSSKKFETTSSGATVTGILSLGNELNMTEGVAATRSIDAFVGDAGTFRIRGTNSGDSGHQILAEFRRNAGVHLNYSGSTKFETTSNGATVSVASGDPQLIVTGPGHAQLQLTSTSGTDHCGVNFGDNDDNNAGMIQYTNSFNAMQIHTNGLERMRIDSSGRVGIGTTSPQVTGIHINGSSARLQLTDSTTGTASGDGVIFGLNGSQDFFINNRESSKNILFFTENTERMRIASDGNVGIGKSSTSLDIDGSIFFGNGQQLQIVQSGSGGKAMNIRRRTNVGTLIQFDRTSSVGSISCNNTSTSYNTSSDYRLKENVVSLSDAITRLKTLKAYRFNFIEDKSLTVDGFMAHEVTAVPEAITGAKDAVVTQAMIDNEEYEKEQLGNIIPQSIDQAKLVPLLVAALQESIAKIETLETEVAALKAA